MAETLTAAEENRLLDGVKQALALVDEQGLHPDAALAKIARDEQYGPGMIRLLGHAYNTGRQLGQFRANTGILDKLASFPLSDPEKVIADLYPAQVDTHKVASDKAAFDADYNRPPDWLPNQAQLDAMYRPLTGLIKAAEALPVAPAPVDQVRLLQQRYGQHERIKRAAEEARRHQSVSYDNFLNKLGSLIEYFKSPSYTRLPFAQVEHAVNVYYDKQATDLLDLVYQRARLREKRAAAVPVQRQPFDHDQPPFTMIRDTLQATADLLQARAWAKEAEDYFAVHAVIPGDVPFVGTQGRPPPKAAAGSPTVLAGSSKAGSWSGEVAAIAAGDILGGTYLDNVKKKKKDDDPEIADADDDTRTEAIREIRHLSREAQKSASLVTGALRKYASLGPAALGGVVATALNRSVGDFPKTKQDLVNDAWMDLEDPAHQNELRRIRAQTLLSGMLSDPEDPISGHDPEKVLDAFNEISQLSPRTAEQPAAIKPLLRKRMAGNVEPFEVKELTDIEHGLMRSKTPQPNQGAGHASADLFG